MIRACAFRRVQIPRMQWITDSYNVFALLGCMHYIIGISANVRNDEDLCRQLPPERKSWLTTDSIGEPYYGITAPQKKKHMADNMLHKK